MRSEAGAWVYNHHRRLRNQLILHPEAMCLAMPMMSTAMRRACQNLDCVTPLKGKRTASDPLLGITITYNKSTLVNSQEIERYTQYPEKRKSTVVIVGIRCESAHPRTGELISPASSTSILLTPPGLGCLNRTNNTVTLSVVCWSNACFKSASEAAWASTRSRTRSTAPWSLTMSHNWLK
jgi:hypothetical protein